MILWHRYPQDEDAHQDRPWWRYLWPASHEAMPIQARRSDGLYAAAQPPDLLRWHWSGPEVEGWRPPVIPEPETTVLDALLRILDAACPLPAPPQLVGQVWHWPANGRTCFVGGDDWPPRKDVFMVATGRGSAGDLPPWPPPGAVLVAGPLSPWAPADYEVTR